MSSQRSSVSGGVPVFSIGGRMVQQRERLLGMTEEERRWRAQYLKDQILSPNEPRYSPEYYRATTNIFRRMIRFPMQLLENALTPILGKRRAKVTRFVAGRHFVLFMASYYVTYYFMYNQQDWTTESGFVGGILRDSVLPGDPDYPNVKVLEDYEYYDLEFSKSFFFKK